MPIMRFIKDGWDHKAGDVVEKSIADSLVLIEGGFAVDHEKNPPVERAVQQDKGTRTATIKR